MWSPHVSTSHARDEQSHVWGRIGDGEGLGKGSYQVVELFAKMIVASLTWEQTAFFVFGG